MLFQKKTWKDRLSEFPGRRKLKNISTNAESVYDVTRAEGEVFQAGDAYNAENMNDLEQRILAAIGTGTIPEGLGNDIVSAITKLNSDKLNSLSERTVLGDVVREADYRLKSLSELDITAEDAISLSVVYGGGYSSADVGKIFIQDNYITFQPTISQKNYYLKWSIIYKK